MQPNDRYLTQHFPGVLFYTTLLPVGSEVQTGNLPAVLTDSEHVRQSPEDALHPDPSEEYSGSALECTDEPDGKTNHVSLHIQQSAHNT